MPKMKKIKIKVKKLAPPTITNVFIDEIKELPSGYYMPAPVIGMVSPKNIISGSKTTYEQCESMKLVFLNIQSNNNNDNYNNNDFNNSINSLNNRSNNENYHQMMISRKVLRNNNNNDNNNKVTIDEQVEIDKILKNKLTMNDLPIPANYNYEINRLHKANDLRRKVLIDKKKLKLRNYLEKDDIDDDDDNNNNNNNNMKSKKLEITKPITPKSYYNENNQNKMFSYHHNIEKSHEDKLPIYHVFKDNECKSSSSYISLLRTDLYPQDIHFMSTLRSTTPSSSSSSSSQYQLSSSQSPSFLSTPGTALNTLSSPYYDKNHLKSTPKITTFSTTIHQSSASQHNENNIDGHNDKETSGSKYFSFYRPRTEIKSFTFETDKILLKRHQDKEKKLKKQQDEEKLINNKKKNQQLKIKQKAIENAQYNGVYKSPITRYHYHQKIINKYNNNSEIIGNLNLQHEIRTAYHEYSKQHHLNIHENDTLYSTKNDHDRLQAIKNIQHIEYIKDMNMILDLQKEFNDYDEDYSNNNMIDFNKKYIHT